LAKTDGLVVENISFRYPNGQYKGRNTTTENVSIPDMISVVVHRTLQKKEQYGI